MPAGKFHHFGVPTKAKQKNETYIAGGKVYVTDPEAHPYRVEFVRFEADSPMPQACQTHCHAAFMVDNLEAAMKGQNVLIQPFDATPTLRVAFITDGEAVIELMEEK
jgi:hypothetical protein